MSFVQNLPITTYDFSTREGENAVFVVPDLLTRVTTYISEEAMNSMTETYIIREGETPEQIAHRVYGEVEYYWTILYLNNITSILEEWPLTEIQLEEFAKKKYPGYSPDITQQYELSGTQLDANSTLLRLENHIDSALNVQNFWRLNVGDYIAEESQGIFAKGTTIVSFSKNNTTNEYEVILSTPSLIAIKETDTESPDYPITFPIKFNPKIEAHLAVKYWEDDLGVAKDKNSITSATTWMTAAGTPTSMLTTVGENATAVTNLTHEIIKNDAKREIKIVKQEYIRAYVASILGELKV